MEKIESGSQIFYPYKSIGYVSSGVPFQLRAENLHYSIMLAIGNSFQLLNSIKLHPRLISNSQEGKIRSMGFYKKEYCLTNNKKEINLWKGPNLEFKFKGHSSTVTKIMVLDNILFSLTKNNEFFMWDINSRLIFEEQLPQFDASTHRITSFIHPTGYFNKILIGFESGELQLWNIKTKKKIYTFKAFGIQESITTIEQSPVLDVVAIGFNDGTIIIHNIKLDKSLVKYQQKGRVNSISFRTDGLKQHIASSGPAGDILVWDLEKNKQFHHMVLAHGSECSKVQFLREEPILVSTGFDNSIKMWNFNGVDGLPVLLRERAGHLDPPKATEFFGDDENSIVSMSNQSIRYISLAASTINHEMSKKKMKNEMKSFKGFSSNFRRNRSWETAVSIHNDSKIAFSWDCSELSVKKQFNIKSPISFTKISSCGNFAFFGTVFGNIYKFNIQSGIKRAKAISPQKTAITSILVEPTNQYIITSGLDSCINYWDFKTLSLLHTIDINDIRIRITKMNLHQDSGIFSVCSDDRYVRLFDIETRNMVRKFKINGKIIDAIFNHDGRWVIVCTDNDSLIRIFDIPSGKMIDWFKMPKPITSISFSPKGEYLITTHTGQLPIYLWSNQFHFGSVFLKEPPTQPRIINLPSQVVEITQNISDDSDSNEEDGKSKIKQIDSLITLSQDIAKSKWQTLLNLDIIKERNRPIQQKAKPELAPFFLSTIEGLEPKFVKADIVNPLTPQVKENGTRTKFNLSLEQGYKNQDYSSSLSILKSLAPSGIDFEIRTLTSTDDYADIHYMFDFIVYQLLSNNDYDFIQSILSVTLKVHGYLLYTPDFKRDLRQLLLAFNTPWSKIQELFHSNICMLRYFTNTLNN
ncbi:hypothetical protein DICPUDRAFT_26840 [Dictyostelium purpureum]|uniref:Uncharacterized protein n=1 Tax=Dictyostelium purpureum TaxID=5786 RepID=F0Z9B2_DICPU|nr:uncharacterized protein DICPUDRAFT_26840 [Dictyostelium purpureum]EGC39440.1 hypothetical protein DICPUDRAFT_26840 [Dictyostelium purpureum]|eukprot:XP_003283998.1 hypothetical protein DICPUDRAFT_26840 [Dictyostelium purpureum]